MSAFERHIEELRAEMGMCEISNTTPVSIAYIGRTNYMDLLSDNIDLITVP
jgi:hypothetical protein